MQKTIERVKSWSENYQGKRVCTVSLRSKGKSFSNLKDAVTYASEELGMTQKLDVVRVQLAPVSFVLPGRYAVALFLDSDSHPLLLTYESTGYRLYKYGHEYIPIEEIRKL
jgi:hypothetical protein